jgi:hypothetical protein
VDAANTCFIFTRRAARARRLVMPFDGTDPEVEKSVRVLTMMERKLQRGRMWGRDDMFARGGKMCLLGASYFSCNVGAGRRPEDRALEYVARAIRPGSHAKDWSDRCWVETNNTDFNDSCAGYDEIERVLRAAQVLARADITAAQLA